MSNPSPNLENLKKGKDTQFTSGDTAVIQGKKGGIKSGEVRRERKELSKMIELALKGKIPDHLLKSVEKRYGKEKAKTLTMFEAIVGRQIERALIKADTITFRELMDRVEGKPVSENDIRFPDGLPAQSLKIEFNEKEVEEVLNKLLKKVNQ